MKHKLVLDGNSRNRIGRFIILIFGISLWVVAIINQAYLLDYHSAVSVRYQEPVVTSQEMDAITRGMIAKEDNHIPEVTLWHRAEAVAITNEAINTSLSIGLITVAGDMTKVYPDSLLYGGYLSKVDNTGCVIDRNTAYKLFHTENAVGLTLSLADKEYIVRGIMREIGSNAMIIQEEIQMIFSHTEGIRYSCMELVFSDTEDAKRLAESFLITNGLGTPTTYMDGYRYQRISELLIHIPLWLSALLLILYLARKVNRLKSSRVLFVSGWLGIILLSAILIQITKVHFHYSSSMLPTRWSDFDFWGNQWKLFIHSLSGREGSIQYYKDMALERRMVFVVVGVILAVILQGVSMKVITDYRYKGKGDF